MPISLPLSVSELALRMNLTRIKRTTLRARNVRSSIIHSTDFAAFAPKLDSDWGALHDGLLQFVQDVCNGQWRARPGQRAPTSLVGDFGEYFITKEYCEQYDHDARVVRVIRAHGLKRPDFLIFEPSSGMLTALECKASIQNAADLQLTPLAGVDLAMCKRLKERRNAGLEQIGDQSIRKSIRGKIALPTNITQDAVNYGDSRVIANRSVIGVMLVPDGRLSQTGSLAHIPLTQVPTCRTTCRACPTGVSRVHLIFFSNNEQSVAPLAPQDRAEEIFAVMARLEEAVWSRSASNFTAHVDQLGAISSTLIDVSMRSDQIRYVCHLLDMIAVGLEQQLITLRDAFTIARRTGKSLLDDALEVHIEAHQAEPQDQEMEPPSPQLGPLPNLAFRRMVVDNQDILAQAEQVRRALERVSPSFGIWAMHFLTTTLSEEFFTRKIELAQVAAMYQARQLTLTGHFVIRARSSQGVFEMPAHFVVGSTGEVCHINFVSTMDQARVVAEMLLPSAMLRNAVPDSDDDAGIVAITRGVDGKETVQLAAHRSGLGFVRFLSTEGGFR